MDETDYPAAHSMDTLWYAVDRDGRVARFWSDEPGAVPAVFNPDNDAVNQLQWPPSEPAPARFDPSGQFSPGGPARLSHELFHTGEESPQGNALVFLDEAALLCDELLRSGTDFTPVPVTDGTAVYFESLPALLNRWLHDSAVCRGCVRYYGDLAELTEGLHGFYSYDYQYGPECCVYGREAVPTRPLHVDQLPPDLRNAVGRVRFDSVSFAETPHVQPIEHVPCVHWGQETYLGTDGVVRPMPPESRSE